MPSKAKQTKNSKTISRKKIFWFSFLASLLLLITTSAIWVNQQIFNADNFSQTVTTSLTSESSRDAIAQSITDEIYAERPVAKRVVGNFTVKIISGVLDTDQFKNVLGTAVEKLQIYATSSDQQSVEIELGGVKDIINQVTEIANNLGEDTSIDTAKIPDSITIINANDVPDFYKLGVVFMWLAPLTLILAITLLAYPYVKKTEKPNQTLLLQGTIITLAGLFGLLIGPLFRPALLGQVNKQSGRIVLGNIYDSFITTFDKQIALMIYIGLLMVLVAVIWLGYPVAKKSFSKQTK